MKVKTKLVGKAADIVEVVTRNSSLHRVTASAPVGCSFYDFTETFTSRTLLDFSPRAPPAVCFRCKCSASFGVDARYPKSRCTDWQKVGVLFIYSALYCRVYFDSKKKKKDPASWPSAYPFTTRSNNRCQNYCAGVT